MKKTSLRNTTALALSLSALFSAALKAEQAQTIDINAQPLATAITELGRETGLRIAASARVIADTQTQGVTGLMTPTEALQALLEGTGMSVRSVGKNGVIVSREEVSQNVITLDDGEEYVDLGTIIVSYDPETGQPINPDDPNNTGQVVLDARAIEYRSTGEDANTAIGTLPNVQTRTDVGQNRGGYSNGVPNDIGEHTDDVLNLKPLNLSISGAAVNENNIMIDGVGVNSLSSPTGEYAPKDGETPQLFELYGLHSQTQFVPTSFVEQAEVFDSNVSAKYGGFVGGVVNYKLRKPDLEGPRGSVNFSYQDDNMAKYSLATEDGENPEDRAKPEWTKSTFALDYSTPVSDRTAVLFGYSTQRASTQKQREIQYGSDWVDSKSHSDFYRFAVTHELDNGDALNARVNYTDYGQTWDIPESYDRHLDIKTKSLMADVEYQKQLHDVGFLRNATLDFRVSTQRNEVENESGSNQLLLWSGINHSDADLSGSLDWCSPDPTAGVQNCFTGGQGSKQITDNRISLAADLNAEVGNGNFRSGIEYQYFDVHNVGSGFEQYFLGAANAQGTCLPGDPTCNADQFLQFRTAQDAYDVGVTAQQVGLYVEADQTFGDWTLRAGLRGDYNDVFDNFDIAPRLSATWNAADNFSLSFGANRYYDDNHLSYAVHDATPGPLNSLRFGNPLADWGPSFGQGLKSYTSSNLKTPYNDELSVSMSYNDAWTNGIWRLRGLKRKGKDLFAQSETTMLSGGQNLLTNDGSSDYESISLEYQKTWNTPSIRFLDAVGLYTSLTWADRKTSHNSYFANETAVPDRIWYKGNGYVENEFDTVRGNLDIPLRGSVELRSSWSNDLVRLGLIADMTDSYIGAVETGDRYTNPADGERYDVYEDHAFGSQLQLHLNSSIRLFTNSAGNEFRLDVRVNNLLDEKQNGTATDSNPYVKGRTVWIGGNYTF
ncbi:TonB-dependent receptor [Shimia sp. MMG029]|uniref:TonB-dependent receptor n=1 Tax=Shimia sp. MMG029 TaxID=3021978 RepID=UPI0022FDB107|nr:TonB-dependent receptor [Shimia sp. MMG029]MDA5556445.1 TonB-dependent receptor [Shimia sp. MMG029]